jgi:endonuclease YncB( thermonuclease family)
LHFRTAVLTRIHQLAQSPTHRVALLLPLLLAGNEPTLAQRRSAPVLVRRVVDGDTIDIAAIGRVQLLGVDAPEIGNRTGTSAPFARQAQQRLEGLLANRWVRLEYESGATTASSRSAYVFLEDGRLVNEWLVREGLARVAARQTLRRLPELRAAEEAARQTRRGIWQDAPPPR